VQFFLKAEDVTDLHMVVVRCVLLLKLIPWGKQQFAQHLLLQQSRTIKRLFF